MAEKKKKSKILVPITPELLRDDGWVPVGWPFEDAAFDSSNDWKHLYRFHGSKGYTNGKTPVGSIRIERQREGDSLRFLIAQRFEHDAGRNHDVKATVHCAADPVATPEKWQLESRFTDQAGKPVAGTGSVVAGVFKNGKITISTNGYKQTYSSDSLASDWTLIDAVQRLPFEEGKPHRFDMLEELTLFRPQHAIYYRGAELFETGNRCLTLHRFDQVGTGTLPYNYWLDENHRLILFVTLSQAYWLDSPEKKA